MNQNKKRFSLFCAITSVCLCSISAIQHIIFYKANKKNKQECTKKMYPYQYGMVAYQVYGTGRPLLLLHNTEIGASGAEWQNNIESLSRMYQVFVPDLPGFGDSQKPKITYTSYQYALFINYFIENVIQRPASIIASSASADFAIMAYALNSKNIRKLVLISPTGLQNHLPTNKENHKRILLQSPLLGTQFFISATSKKAIKKHLTENIFFSKEIVTKELIENYYIMAHKGNENARFLLPLLNQNSLMQILKKYFKKLKFLFVLYGEKKTESICQNKWIL